MPSLSQMRILETNADAADKLLQEINAKIGDIQHKIKIKEDANQARVESSSGNLTECEKVRAEILYWQKCLTIRQIRNGKPYFPSPKLTAVSSGSGDVSTSDTVEQEKTPKIMVEAIPSGDNNKKPIETKAPKKDAGGSSSKQKASQHPPADDVDVGRLDFRIGKIVDVDRHPDADSLYVEKVDVGEENPRTVVSGLVKHVSLEEMRNRVVVLLCNLKPAKMRGITSEAMVMCASSPEKVEILVPPPGVIPGDLVEFDGITRKADPVLNPKKKIFETVAPDLKTNGERIATYKGIPFEVKGKGFVSSPTLINVNIK